MNKTRYVYSSVFLSKAGDGIQFVAATAIILSLFENIRLLPLLIAIEFLVSTFCVFFFSRLKLNVSVKFLSLLDVILFGLTLLLSLLIYFDRLSIPLFLLLSPLILSLRVLWNISFKSITPSLAEDLITFNVSINNLKQGGAFCGFLLAGLLINVSQIHILVIVNSFTFLFSSLLLWKISTDFQKTVNDKKVDDGGNEHSGYSRLFVVTVASYALVLGLIPCFEMIVPVVVHVQDSNSFWLGILAGLTTIGTVIGGLIAKRVPSIQGIEVYIVVICALCLTLSSVVNSFPLACALLFLASLIYSFQSIYLSTIQSRLSQSKLVTFFSGSEICAAIIVFFIFLFTTYTRLPLYIPNMLLLLGMVVIVIFSNIRPIIPKSITQR